MFERLTGGWRFINLQNVGEINYRSHKFAIWLFWQCIFDSRSFRKCTHFLGTNSLIPCSRGIPWTHYTVHTKKIAQYGKVYSKNVARLKTKNMTVITWLSYMSLIWYFQKRKSAIWACLTWRKMIGKSSNQILY
jgi:hypothetical protein